MTDRLKEQMPSDEQLVAYLDGELPPEESEAIRTLALRFPAIAERLDFLGCGGAGMRAAFEPLLQQAPREKLEARLAEIPVPAQNRAQRWSRRHILGAALLCLGTGIAVDRAFVTLAKSPVPQADDGEDWHSAVAEYLVLYTADTLNNAASNLEEQTQQVRFTGERLGLNLSLPALQLPDFSLKRAQVLDYEGMPLGQILYVHPRYGAFAFCIVAQGGAERPVRAERLHGLNVVHWSTAVHGFIVAGRNPHAELANISARLQNALDS